MSRNLAQLAAKELLRRTDALADMREYRKTIVHQDFHHPPAAHHLVMIGALHGLERGDYSRLLIMAPPGSAKSTYCSVQFVTWYLARRPGHQVLACSNTTELAENFNRRRRSVCLSPEWMRLSGSKLDENAQGVSRFQTTAGGACVAAGVGSAIVGLRSNLNVLDDPIRSMEEALSPTQLEKIWQWYQADFRSRLVPNGKELIVTTRWSRNDVAGHILRLVEQGEEDWHVVRLPMLADSHTDPLGRSPGTPLWPEWFTDQMVRENQRDPLRWSTLYQQTPMDAAGSWVGEEHIQLEPSPPPEMQIVIGVDLALTVGQGDYTAIVVAGIDAERNIHVVDVHRSQSSPDVTVQRLFAIAQQYTPTAVLIDDDNASKVLTRMIYEMARAQKLPLPLSMMPLRGRNKEIRAAALRGWFMQGRVYIRQAPWTHDLVREVLEFPSGTHDDQIDALSLIGRRLAETPGADKPEHDESADPYDGFLLRPDTSGGFVTNFTLGELVADHAQERRWHRPRI
jgi:predicted phage terminase large subunit-like protein